MIMQSVATGDAGPAVQKKFKERAEELLREGVVGFRRNDGRAFRRRHAVSIRPAGPSALSCCLRILPRNTASPSTFTWKLSRKRCPCRRPEIAAQCAAAACKYRGVRTAAGAQPARQDYLGARGCRTARDFERPIFAAGCCVAHPNLYMEIKADPVAHGKNYPLADGKIKPDWLKLFTDFPDRFLIGSDQHYPEPKGTSSAGRRSCCFSISFPAM